MLDVVFQGYLFLVCLFFVGVIAAYGVLLVLSMKATLRYLRHNSFGDSGRTVLSQTAPGVSILVPAYNEEPAIIDAVRSLVGISYGRFEVIVINDGSNDQTLVTMTEQLGLHTTNQAFPPGIRTAGVQAVFRSKLPEYRNLVVVDKEHGGRPDALNAGITFAQYELVCAVNVNTLLEEDALQKAVKVFLDDNQVVGVGGIVRIVNGCDVAHGRVTAVDLPGDSLPLFQAVEDFRTLLSGRMAWQDVNGLVSVPDDFRMFHRQALLEVGGYRTSAADEDLDLIVRIHRTMSERRKPYRIAFIPEPVCWTRVPELAWLLARRRQLTYRGLLDVARVHGKMLFDQAYGKAALMALPHLLLVDLLAPVLELGGYTVTLLMLLSGSVELELAGMFLIVSIVYGVLFSIVSILLEEVAFRRYPDTKHLLLLMGMGVLENFGYRQLTAWWRIRAIVDELRGTKGDDRGTRAAAVPAEI
jgi:cellulose synthase/poly-beta-1,6-N-acetylglucosamine synthase-like glycosyltransferase